MSILDEEILWNCDKVSLIILPSDYTIISNRIIFDKNLSWAAKGVATHIVQLSSNFHAFRSTDYPSELIQELLDQRYLRKD